MNSNLTTLETFEDVLHYQYKEISGNRQHFFNFQISNPRSLVWTQTFGPHCIHSIID